MIETTKLYIFDVSLDDLALTRSQLYEKSNTPMSILSEISQSILMKNSILPEPVGFWKLMLDLFFTLFKGENSTDVIL